MIKPNRSQVLYLGERPFSKTPYEQRRLTVTPVKLTDLADANVLNTACGIVVGAGTGKYGLLYSYFEEYFQRVCEFGLVSAFWADEKAQIVNARDSTLRRLRIGETIGDPQRRRDFLDALPWIYIAADEWQIAETLARHNPGPPLGTPTIVPVGRLESLDPEATAILQRSFYDAERITVRHLAGGRVAKGTYCVFANLSGPEKSPQPMPFFVKIGNPDSIEREKQNYRDLVEPFVPFHLRPAMNQSRSFSTLTSSALVGNFVENAIPLRTALRSGAGDGTIFSLFEVTLRGLRLHAVNSPKQTGVIEAFLEEKARAEEIESKHPSRIAVLEAFGFKEKPTSLQQKLKERAASIPARQSHYHGDPHFGNIMVRNRDAIVIDFGSMGSFGPIYADPAILEVSLVFGTDNDDDPKAFETWSDLVDQLYDNPLNPPVLKGDFPAFSWLIRAIRELRHVVACCGLEESEALIVLAGCLLRYGRNSVLPLDSQELENLAERRRSYALVVAYRIAQKMENNRGAC